MNKNTATLMTKVQAAETARLLNAEENAESDGMGWRYVAVHDPQGTGSSFIAVYENANFLGRL